ncbi:putative phage-associated protein [Paenibacillus cellulosilyticus]|uniref:Putative phage-associated protein n=1 Tax=Paenibacillus cellulosilyticus TaxID=375489 RepID=A0A2V2YSI8_9BACL|nr:type II toxin-antitoxin system antitoxin SocA domain-containing protein [Paenibacillus cellulosilyticus]PWW01168.1 putative phage-associated protein [Paenibacillus cellulosilyticus]QKS46871.1 DUF4065 domain-containing protein [Paenibacillus cellulosilyticus]
MASIYDVANYFRWRTDYDAGDYMTNLKLQKLCYYAQAWHLVFTCSPMFNNDLEAWDHGPVNRVLYKHYRSQSGRSWDPIEPDEEIENFSPAGVFSLSELETLQEVWDSYGDLSAKRLEDLTHQEAPWLNTAKNCIIDPDRMREYYTAVLRGA